MGSSGVTGQNLTSARSRDGTPRLADVKRATNGARHSAAQTAHLWIPSPFRRTRTALKIGWPVSLPPGSPVVDDGCKPISFIFALFRAIRRRFSKILEKGLMMLF
jgi:hypothetical protein